MKKIKNYPTILILIIISSLHLFSQNKARLNDDEKINILIDQYSKAREMQDTILLKKILTSDIDQLVSTGEWRHGLTSAIKGMLRSTASHTGKSIITIDKIKYLTSFTAIVDTRYDVPNADGTIRNMWSCFVVVKDHTGWKISAIRNMMPTVTN